ncbi:hypothetical protein ONT16_16705 [Prevotella copri]|uniref:Uncharacterized protein n=1 Tax=Segatella copri TaxID=165179 RepID=A0AAP3BEX0_9BACT|nr:hypothetical protein [Segatella copri]MCW4129851.1 hypothetical protein [Segatella copri]MCW4415433.1 hypothetical protein [Segatella copri]MCW4422514.1 hypothetical protein [Segatella copri]
MAQKYVAQPKENGKYEVARFNEITRQYEHVGDCLSEEDAIELAHSLNEHDRIDGMKYDFQNGLIGK